MFDIYTIFTEPVSLSSVLWVWVCVAVDVMDGHGGCGGSRSVVIWMCMVSE